MYLDTAKVILGFHASLQATPTSTIDPLSLGSPEPVAAVADSKPSASKSSTFQDDDDLFNDPLLGSGGGKPPVVGKPPVARVPETKSRPSPKPGADMDPLGGPLGARAAKDDLFSTSGRTDGQPTSSTEKEADKAFSNAPQTAPAVAPKKPAVSQNVSKPKPKSSGLFDGDDSDDDLFSVPKPRKEEPEPAREEPEVRREEPPPKKQLPGAVPMFGGIDPLAGKAKLNEAKVGADQVVPREPARKPKDDLFGNSYGVDVTVTCHGEIMVM